MSESPSFDRPRPAESAAPEAKAESHSSDFEPTPEGGARSDRTRKRSERIQHERQDRQHDDRSAERLLRQVEVEADIDRVLHQKTGPEQITALFRLLIQLFARGQGEGRTSQAADGTMVVSGTEEARILKPGEAILDSGSLDSDRTEIDPRERSRERVWTELTQGKSAGQIEQERKATVAAADRVIDTGSAAARDTAKHNRLLALNDLDTVARIRFSKAKYAARLNDEYRLIQLAGDPRSSADLSRFAQAKFGLDDDLQIVLRGVTPEAVAAAGGLTLDAPHGQLVARADANAVVIRQGPGNPVGLVFVRSEDGKSYVLRTP